MTVSQLSEPGCHYLECEPKCAAVRYSMFEQKVLQCERTAVRKFQNSKVNDYGIDLRADLLFGGFVCRGCHDEWSASVSIYAVEEKLAQIVVCKIFQLAEELGDPDEEYLFEKVRQFVMDFHKGMTLNEQGFLSVYNEMILAQEIGGDYATFFLSKYPSIKQDMVTQKSWFIMRQNNKDFNTWVNKSGSDSPYGPFAGALHPNHYVGRPYRVKGSWQRKTASACAARRVLENVRDIYEYTPAATALLPVYEDKHPGKPLDHQALKKWVQREEGAQQFWIVPVWSKCNCCSITMVSSNNPQLYTFCGHCGGKSCTIVDANGNFIGRTPMQTASAIADVLGWNPATHIPCSCGNNCAIGGVQSCRNPFPEGLSRDHVQEIKLGAFCNTLTVFFAMLERAMRAVTFPEQINTILNTAYLKADIYRDAINIIETGPDPHIIQDYMDGVYHCRDGDVQDWQLSKQNVRMEDEFRLQMQYVISADVSIAESNLTPLPAPTYPLTEALVTTTDLCDEKSTEKKPLQPTSVKTPVSEEKDKKADKGWLEEISKEITMAEETTRPPQTPQSTRDETQTPAKEEKETKQVCKEVSPAEETRAPLQTPRIRLEMTMEDVILYYIIILTEPVRRMPYKNVEDRKAFFDRQVEKMKALKRNMLRTRMYPARVLLERNDIKRLLTDPKKIEQVKNVQITGTVIFVRMVNNWADTLLKTVTCRDLECNQGLVHPLKQCPVMIEPTPGTKRPPLQITEIPM